MSALDREKLGRLLGELRAEEIKSGVLWTDQQWADAVLTACPQDVNEPYWNARAELDRRKLAAVAALCADRAADPIEYDPIWPDELRAILSGSSSDV